MSNPKLLKGRTSEVGTYCAITTVAAERRPLFADASLARLVMAELRHADNAGAAWTIAWVVMPDHVHWLFRLEYGSLAACMQAFKSRSARAANAATGRHGQIWQTGYYGHGVRHEEDLVTQARYIIANPIRKGLAVAIEEYPFWWCRWINGTTDL